MFTKTELDVEFILEYETGLLYRRSSGKLAVHNHSKYYRVFFRGSKYYAHHIVWCITRGYWPNEKLDHWDGNGYNNRPDNLREATGTQNLANADYGPSRGIEAHGNKYRVRIWCKGIRHNIGSFDTLLEAHEAYKEAANKLFGVYAFHNRDA